MNWFKFYGQDFLTDPKIKSLDPLHQLGFVYLLCLGSQTEGVIKHLTLSNLCLMMGIFPDTNEGVRMQNFFDKLVELEMITNDNAAVVITNYQKRQNSNLTGYERVKRFREKNKTKTSSNVINDNVKDNGDDNTRIDKIREDKNRKEYIQEQQIKKTNNLVLTKSQKVTFLKEFRGLTSVELDVEIKKCNDYMNMSSSNYTNPGLFFRGWLKKVMEEKARKKANQEQLEREREAMKDMSPEEREKAQKKIDEIRKGLNKKFKSPV